MKKRSRMSFYWERWRGSLAAVSTRLFRAKNVVVVEYLRIFFFFFFVSAVPFLPKSKNRASVTHALTSSVFCNSWYIIGQFTRISDFSTKMSVDFNALAQQFCNFYYDQFDKDRSQLGNLYVSILQEALV